MTYPDSSSLKPRNSARRHRPPALEEDRLACRERQSETRSEPKFVPDISPASDCSLLSRVAGLLLTAIGLIMADTAILRSGTWSSRRRFTPLALGSGRWR